MRLTPITIVRVALGLLLTAAAARAQDAQLDSALVALTYHKLTGDALDVNAVAAQSEAVRRVSEFDRRDATAAEAARIQARLAGATAAHEFFVRVDDEISQYDHDRGEFSVGLFQPGYYVPVQAFGQEYRLVFANAERARPIPMPKEQARAFDAKLQSLGRRVTNEIRFRIVGGGDPAGAVTGPRVVRAELLGVRLLDRAGQVVYTPTIAPVTAAAAAATPAFDAARADVAGFRVGVKAKELEGTLRRLFGPVTRGSAGSNAFPGYAATLVVNDMGCMSLPGRRRNPTPGAVCVTAFLDGDDVVRAIRVERLFPWVDAEVFRRALVQKYGPVAGAESGSGMSLGWGPAVDARLVYDRSGPHTALTAHWTEDDDFMSRGLNRAADVRVVLQLVDAEWATAHATR